jgi:hypothetical protein
MRPVHANDVLFKFSFEHLGELRTEGNVNDFLTFQPCYLSCYGSADELSPDYVM